MDYELAKELEDAGFPQNPHGYSEAPKSWISESGKIGDWESFDPEGTVYLPNLSELIEACDLWQLSFGFGKWSALSFPQEDGFKSGVGKTPKEAVAKLYIATKKQHER